LGNAQGYGVAHALPVFVQPEGLGRSGGGNARGPQTMPAKTPAGDGAVAPFQGFKKTARKNDSASVDLGRCPRLLRPSLSGWTPPRPFPAQSYRLCESG